MGDIGHGCTVFTFLVGICTFRPVNGFIRLFVSPLFEPRPRHPFPLLLLLPPLLSLPPPPPPPLLPLIGDGLSSFDLRFSGRGGRNAVGDVDGVVPPPFAADEVAFDAAAADDDDDEDVVVVEEPLPAEMDDVDVDVVFVVDVVDAVVVRPPRPFAPPFRNLL